MLAQLQRRYRGVAVALLPAACVVLAVAPVTGSAATGGASTPAVTDAAHATLSQAAISACAAPADFIDVAGQGPLCQADSSFVLQLRSGDRLTVAPPDTIAALKSNAPAASVPHTTTPVSAQQCVTGNSPRIELFYAHFAGSPDNFAAHAADIEQMFRDVDADYINYDAMHYWGSNMHLYVECDASGNLIVHDVALSTSLGASSFSTIASDMQSQGYDQNYVHYWIWTDGNPEAAYGYAGQSSIEEDDSAGPSNSINTAYQYSVNYGYPDGDYGPQVFAHENGHAMGAVQLSAPNSTGAFHCTDGADVMCYNDGGPYGSDYSASYCTDEPNGTEPFDCKQDNYFNPDPPTGSYLATHWNLASANNHWISVGPTTTSTALKLTPASGVYGAPMTMWATVSPPAPGGVTFFDDGTKVITAPLNSLGQAWFTDSGLSTGQHAITASYAGSGSTMGSTAGAQSYTVAAAGSTLSLSPSSNPAGLNAPVDLIATVTPVAPSTATPSGQVTFYSDGTQLGTAGLNNGQAVLPASFSSEGDVSLTASYAGDGNFNGADDTSSPVTLDVKSAADISVRSSAPGDSGEIGTPVTFTVSVAAASGEVGSPTGSVTFDDGSARLGGPVPLSGGSAQLTTSDLLPGSHDITADYSGDSSFAPSATSLTETVQGWSGLTALDGYGGVHSLDSPGLANTPPLWNVVLARAVALDGAGTGGYMLDGYGGIHPFGTATPVALSGYWPGFDIARAIVLRPDGHSGYTLDGYGGVHAFGGAPPVQITGYWPGFDIARSIVLRSDGESGYVLDGYGGIHPFGVRGDIAPAARISAYWGGIDTMRVLSINPDGLGGYVMDSWGNVHPWGDAAPIAFTSPWEGNVATGMVVVPGTPEPMGYVLNGDGQTAPFGGAPPLALPPAAVFPGTSVDRGLAVS